MYSSFRAVVILGESVATLINLYSSLCFARRKLRTHTRITLPLRPKVVGNVERYHAALDRIAQLLLAEVIWSTPFKMRNELIDARTCHHHCHKHHSEHNGPDHQHIIDRARECVQVSSRRYDRQKLFCLP